MGIATNLAALARLLSSSGAVPGAAISTDAALPSGMVQYFTRSAAPSGWVKANGQTIGSAASGATGRANADTAALYAVLWADFSNTLLPIQDSAGAASTRGASAAADFAANKRLPLPDLRAEFLRGLDDGRSVDTGRVLGSAQTEMIGPHTHGMTQAMPAITNGAGAINRASSNTADKLSGTTDTNSGTENRPRNVAYLACIKL
jgi:hypothetical protein